ncbi:MAG: hypothetical protein HY340_03910 [Candidatus Kerfeldbacteria bacterium]|nr:hypothetical protein [Candidatus Kerfeldbacteria bacterium]
MTATERETIVPHLWTWCRKETSRIVRTFALQTLADFSAHDPALRRTVQREPQKAQHSPIFAIRSRSKIILKAWLKQQQQTKQ